jgi:hypothetical protein
MFRDNRHRLEQSRHPLHIPFEIKTLDGRSIPKQKVTRLKQTFIKYADSFEFRFQYGETALSVSEASTAHMDARSALAGPRISIWNRVKLSQFRW